MAAQFTEKLTKVPAIPKEFGEDGGKFYKYYDELADELDEDMVTSLKSQLDGILIFAGLFAGVNSAFLAFTLPQMSADPADDTNALLFQILLGGNNTIGSPADLPSASFTPPTGALPINILFAMSLTLALLASFLAVLGQQWLVYYRKRSGGGVEHQRWEQLRRYLGAKRWKLELVLDDLLPSILQVALVIFCVAFIMYLSTLRKSLCYAIAAPLCAAGGLILAMAIASAWDHWCPFKSPLTHLFQPILKYPITFSGIFVAVSVASIATAYEWMTDAFRSRLLSVGVRSPGGNSMPSRDFKEEFSDVVTIIADWFLSYCQRDAEATGQLKVVALKRVLCTSEDPSALAYAAVNAHSITERGLLRQILDDDELKDRFNCLANYPRFQTRAEVDPKVIQAQAIAASFLYILLSAGKVEDFIPSDSMELGLGSPLPVISLNFIIGGDLQGYTPLDYGIDIWRLIYMDRSPNLNPPEFEERVYRNEDPRSVSYVWLVAWVIKTLHDRGNGSSEEVRSYSPGPKLEEFRDFLALYQEVDMTNVFEVIGKAIATSSSDWNDRPDHQTFLSLFERALKLRVDLSKDDTITIRGTVSMWASAVKDLVTLLRYLEDRIRDPATTSDDRESQRQHRRTCIRKYIECSGTNTPDIYTYGPISLRYYETADALQSYLTSIKRILDEDPTHVDNLQMVLSAKLLFDRMPHPRDHMDENEWLARELGWSTNTMEAYTQLHSTLMGEMAEIQARFADIDWNALEGSETLPENGDRQSADKFSDAPLESWGY